MQPNGCILAAMDDDAVFRALADRQPPAVAGPAAPDERPDAGRAVPGTGDDPSGGDQASRDPGGGEPRRLQAPGPREAALHQSGADQRDRRALDRQVRAAAPARALASSSETLEGDDR